MGESSAATNVVPLRARANSHDSDEDSRPRVEPGKYIVGFVECRRSRRPRYGRDVYDLHFEIVEGPNQGTRLPRFLTKPAKSTRPSERSNFAKDFKRIVELRPPKALYRLKPDDVYKDCQLEVAVDDVELDEDGVEVPHGARYSVIRQVLRRVAGVPPYLQKRGPADAR